MLSVTVFSDMNAMRTIFVIFERSAHTYLHSMTVFELFRFRIPLKKGDLLVSVICICIRFL